MPQERRCGDWGIAGTRGMPQTRPSRILLGVLCLLHAQITRTWFHSGELSWRRDNMTVHFELRTAWERAGYPTTLTRMTVTPAL